MSWTYSQATGWLIRPDGSLAGIGYSGFGDGRNNPEAQTEKDIGPIPRGLWQMGEPRNTLSHGPYVIPLSPDATTDTFGRDGFLVHGDNITSTASHGCIIMIRPIREEMGTSLDSALNVVP